MKTLDDVNKPALRYYIKQAVKVDSGVWPNADST
jgi:hypothetical protein